MSIKVNRTTLIVEALECPMCGASSTQRDKPFDDRRTLAWHIAWSKSPEHQAYMRSCIPELPLRATSEEAAEALASYFREHVEPTRKEKSIEKSLPTLEQVLAFGSQEDLQTPVAEPTEHELEERAVRA